MRIDTLRFILTSFCVLFPLFANPYPTIGPNPPPIQDTGITYFVSPNGNDQANGKTRQTAWKTIQKAVDVMQPGDTVLVMAGTYNEGFWIGKEPKIGRPDAWFTVLAEPGTEIRGSTRYTDFKKVSDQPPIYVRPRPELFPGWWQKKDVPLSNRPEQVFVNGRLLQQVVTKEMLRPTGTFYVDDDEKLLYVCLEGGANPNQQITEVTDKTWAIQIGPPPNMNVWNTPDIGEKHRVAYIRVSGFKVRYIGNFSRQGAVQIRGLAEHIIIEHCDVQWVNYCGIAINGMVRKKDEKAPQSFIQIPKHIIIRNNIVSNNGVQGIGGGYFSHVTVEANILDNNNYKGNSPWNEGGAVKLLHCNDTIIRWNVARNNNNHGLWFDYANQRNVIEYNLVAGAKAGAILNEVTPLIGGNPQDPTPQLDDHVPNPDEVRANPLTGTTIRYNICIGTKPPVGGGINNSNSMNALIYNNILYGNVGHGISLGGSPTRKNANNNFMNKAYSNICDQNFIHAEGLYDTDSKEGRFFGNRQERNLYLRSQSRDPFRISGKLVSFEEWCQVFGPNLMVDEEIFRNPDRWDFTLVKPEYATQIGFDMSSMRLDWSEFFVESRVQGIRAIPKDLTFYPLNLSSIFNRSLYDEVAGDGQGGWTDQGPNDMSQLPLGDQVFGGIRYQLGPLDKGSLLLKTSKVKGEFPTSVMIPVQAKYDEIYFLYCVAWAIKGEILQIHIQYANGKRVIQPIVVGKHVVDWWTDPEWTVQDTLNNHDAYVAWQGPNRHQGRVTVCQLRWVNPEPQEVIQHLTLQRTGIEDAAFFLLGISGAIHSKAQTGLISPNQPAFYLTFDRHVEAVDHREKEISPEQKLNNPYTFNPGSFAPGIKGDALSCSSSLTYRFPTLLFSKGEGSGSIWLKSENLLDPKLQSSFKQADYRRYLKVWELFAEEGRYWGGLSFELDPRNFKDMKLMLQLDGETISKNLGNLFPYEKWINIFWTWRSIPGLASSTEVNVYLQGKIFLQHNLKKRLSGVSGLLYVGVAKNGGQRWYGWLDELAFWDRHFSPEDVQKQITGISQK